MRLVIKIESNSICGIAEKDIVHIITIIISQNKLRKIENVLLVVEQLPFNNRISEVHCLFNMV